VNTFEYGHAYKHLDFVIAPLLNESFNNHKSELKILEASAYNLPIVVSDCYPYKYCENNLGVLFAANDKWEDRIEKMILMSDDARIGMGQLNGEYSRKHYNLEHWCRERELIYKKIINGN
jgi:glycosyltransferase involved in cell wall biosynthesis